VWLDVGSDGLDITDWTALCAFIIAVITAAGLVYRKVWQPMRHASHRAFGVAVVEAIRPELEIIRGEVTDQKSMLLAHLVEEEVQIAALSARQAEQCTRLARIEERLECKE